MKKRTSVCVLILTVGLFHSSMLIDLFGQETSLAQTVFNTHKEILLRTNIQEALPEVLTLLKAPDNQALLTPEVISLFLDGPDRLKALFPSIVDAFITLLKENAEVKTLFGDADVQQLLITPSAIDELAELMNETLNPPVQALLETQKSFNERIRGC